MKNTIIFLLFIIALNGFSQTNATFNKIKYYFGDSINSSANIKSVAQLDSNYYMVVDAYVDSILYNVFIIKTDLEGNMIKKSTCFGSDTIAYFAADGNGLIIDSDSNIVVVGSYIYGEWGGFTIKLNRNLDVIWHQRYVFPDSLLPYSHTTPRHTNDVIKETLDGNYLIAGTYFIDTIYSAENAKLFLHKLDTSGNSIWLNTYTAYSGTDDIVISPDSGFYIPLGINNTMIAIIKFDLLGNMEWFTKVNSANYTSYPVNAHLLDSNYIVIVSAYWYDAVNELRALKVSKVNIQTHQKVWEKECFPSSILKNFGTHQWIELDVLSNNDIIIAATSIMVNHDSTDSGYKGVLLKLNSNGDSLWCRYYNGERKFDDICQFNDLLLTEDGGFLAVGFHLPHNFSNKYGAWLVKIDSMGYAPGGYTIGIEEKNTLIIKKVKPLLYPNPATSNFNLRFEQSPNEDMQLSIYNSAGQLVKQQQLSAFANEYRVDIGELSMGVYFVSLESNGELVYNGKFTKK